MNEYSAKHREFLDNLVRSFHGITLADEVKQESIVCTTSSNIEKEETMSNMDKYKCLVCEYIYDPSKGDPDTGIPPGTSFEDIPDDWTCPICGVGKEQFEKVVG